MSAVAQGGPVREASRKNDSGEIILNIGEGVDPYAGEDPETLALEVLELGAGLMPVVPVGAGAVGIEEDIGGTHQRTHLLGPADGVPLDPVQIHLGRVQVDMAPGVGAEGPASVLEALDDGLDRLDLGLAVGVKGGTAGVVGGDVDVVLGPVAQDALIAGEGEAALGAVEGEVRVGPDKLVQNGSGVQILGEEGLLGVGIGALSPQMSPSSPSTSLEVKPSASMYS